MRSLPPSSGRSTLIILSNLPGRTKAGSSTSLRLVAPKTQIVLVESVSSPSIQVSRAFRVCSASSLLPLPPESLLFLPRASISSIKIMHGPPIFFAFANNCRTRAAPVPAYFSTKSLPEHEMRGTSADAAVARARVVLPVPGGPSRSSPVGARAPTREYFSGFLKVSTSSITSPFALSIPSMSSKDVARSPSAPFFFDENIPGPPLDEDGPVAKPPDL